MEKVFIVGCGDIGRRVAALLGAEGAEVTALARSARAARRLEDAGIGTVPGDLDDPRFPEGLPLEGAVVFYLAPPPDRGETDPRIRAFLDAIPPVALPGRVVYMSTTGVYGDLGGGWASEETPAAPAGLRGRRRLDAERAVLSWGGEKNVDVVVLRVAGIYGPGRLPVERVRAGTPVLDESEAPFTNRIHSDDLARVCVAAARRGKAGAVYNVSDGSPGTITQYYDAVAARLGVPPSPRMTMEEARRVLSEGMLSFLSESRRIDNRRMREELGVDLLYPTLEEGIAASLGRAG